jgi:hypothetical protein
MKKTRYTIRYANGSRLSAYGEEERREFLVMFPGGEVVDEEQYTPATIQCPDCHGVGRVDCCCGMGTAMCTRCMGDGEVRRNA